MNISRRHVGHGPLVYRGLEPGLCGLVGFAEVSTAAPFTAGPAPASPLAGGCSAPGGLEMPDQLIGV